MGGTVQVYRYSGMGLKFQVNDRVFRVLARGAPVQPRGAAWGLRASPAGFSNRSGLRQTPQSRPGAPKWPFRSTSLHCARGPFLSDLLNGPSHPARPSFHPRHMRNSIRCSSASDAAVSLLNPTLLSGPRSPAARAPKSPRWDSSPCATRRWKMKRVRQPPVHGLLPRAQLTHAMAWPRSHRSSHRGHMDHAQVRRIRWRRLLLARRRPVLFPHLHACDTLPKAVGTETVCRGSRAQVSVRGKLTGRNSIIRILFMIPIYATVSWLSIRYYLHSVYLEVIRDCYEAFAIASFFTLLCHYIAPDLHEQKNYFRTIKPRQWVWPLPTFQKCCGGEHGIWRIPRSGLTWFNVSSRPESSAFERPLNPVAGDMGRCVPVLLCPCLYDFRCSHHSSRRPILSRILESSLLAHLGNGL